MSILLSMFAWFSVDFLLTFVGFCFIFCQYSVHILPVLLRVFTGTSTSPLNVSGTVHAKVVPLIVSSHLLNVSHIVSWSSITIWNPTCTVIYHAMTFSKRDLENFLADILFLVRLLSVDICLVFCPYRVRILFVFCPYYRACSQEPAQVCTARPASSTQKWSHLLYRPTY